MMICKIIKNNIQKSFAALLMAIFILLAAAYPLQKQLKELYIQQQSVIISDRNNIPIYIQPNPKGYYSRNLESVPLRFKELLIKKEDRFFFYHLGINPASIARDSFQYVFSRKSKGQSTITQQLVKILLQNEGQRNLKNKIIESAYAVSLELYASKEQILTMYGNTAYFGNQAQGLKEASYFYFNKDPETLSNIETLKLLASLSSPSIRYPRTYENEKMADWLAKNFLKDENIKSDNFKTPKSDKMTRKHESSFEINSLGIKCRNSCQLTIDAALTKKLRDILRQNIENLALANAENGVIIVIKIPENELLAIVGSPYPNSQTQGYQINMAAKPRPIGSTFKPFIYAKAFEKGARPYSLVDDKEYKYEISAGFPLYPKNYDGKYYGSATLHYALSNSLNVPAVKTLEYVGLKNFYNFLENDLQLKTIQPIENYALGIALGGLEMSPLALSEYFTIFPNRGILKPLKIYKTPSGQDPISIGGINDFNSEQKIINEDFIQLINKILSDRQTASDQFGLKSNLNLPQNNYALKTGTSYNYHDSWIMGYTPDFLIGVWLGNSQNRPMRQISGQSGAGKIWREAMQLMLNSEYNKQTPFVFNKIKEYYENNSLEYGLEKDDYEKIRGLLQESQLINNPHKDDVFLFEQNTIIPLKANEKADWFINGKFFGNGDNLSWQPSRPGEYEIKAKIGGITEEKIKIKIESE